jgi:hypothetical protein
LPRRYGSVVQQQSAATRPTSVRLSSIRDAAPTCLNDLHRPACMRLVCIQKASDSKPLPLTRDNSQPRSDLTTRTDRPLRLKSRRSRGRADTAAVAAMGWARVKRTCRRCAPASTRSSRAGRMSPYLPPFRPRIRKSWPNIPIPSPLPSARSSARRPRRPRRPSRVPLPLRHHAFGEALARVSDDHGFLKPARLPAG